MPIFSPGGPLSQIRPSAPPVPYILQVPVTARDADEAIRRLETLLGVPYGLIKAAGGLLLVPIEDGR